MLTHEHALATYRSDGLAQYRQTPVAAVLPGTAEQVQQVVARLLRGGRAVGRAGRRDGPVGRRAAGRRRRPDRARAAAADPVGRARGLADRRRAGGHEPGGLAGRGADALLPARPLEPDRVLDRRQRGRELGRRALLQVRVHDQLRDRARGRAERRHASSSSTGTPPATTCSARSSAPRARSASRPGSPCASSPCPETIRTLVAFFEDTVGRRRGGHRDRRARGSSPARSR